MDARRRFWPQLLPGGKALLTTSPTGFDMPEEVDAVSLADGASRTLVRGAHFGRYLSSGHLAYLRGGTLFVRLFDPKRLDLSGPEVPLLQGVEYSTVDASGQFDVAANGTLIYRAARPGSELKTVQWIDSVGHLEPLLAPPGDYRAIALSRDGKRLALTIAQGGVSDLYVYDLERRQQPGRLTVGAKISSGVPVAWSSDGRYLFFTASDTIWWVPTEGLSQPHEFLRTYSVSTISPDGKRLFAMKTTPHNRVDAWIVPVTVDLNGPRAGQPVPLLQGPVSEANCDGSLDGRWATCMTDDTGVAQIYVIEIANPGRKWLVSSGSGYWSAWANPGHEIFYTTFFAPLRIMVTPYSLEGGHFQPGQPRQWSPVGVPSHDSAGLTDLTMTPDGKRFAALMPAEQPLGNRVTFVMNLFDEVRRRIAAK
jgi:serine/threonine-protein kinase